MLADVEGREWLVHAACVDKIEYGHRAVSARVELIVNRDRPCSGGAVELDHQIVVRTRVAVQIDGGPTEGDFAGRNDETVLIDDQIETLHVQRVGVDVVADRIVAVAGAVEIGVAAIKAVENIVAGAALNRIGQVRSVEADDDVVAGGSLLLHQRGAEEGRINRSVGEVPDLNPRIAFQNVDDPQDIAIPEVEDQVVVVSLGAAMQFRYQVARSRIEQVKADGDLIVHSVAAGPVVDRDVSVARIKEIAIRSAVADQYGAVEGALKRILAERTLRAVASRRRSVLNHQRADFVQIEDRSVLKTDLVEPLGKIRGQRVDPEETVRELELGSNKLDNQVVAIRSEPPEDDVIGIDVFKENLIKVAETVIHDLIEAVARTIKIDVLFIEPVQKVVACAADDQVLRGAVQRGIRKGSQNVVAGRALNDVVGDCQPVLRRGRGAELVRRRDFKPEQHICGIANRIAADEPCQRINRKPARQRPAADEPCVEGQIAKFRVFECEPRIKACRDVLLCEEVVAKAVERRRLVHIEIQRSRIEAAIAVGNVDIYRNQTGGRLVQRQGKFACRRVDIEGSRDRTCEGRESQLVAVHIRRRNRSRHSRTGVRV